MSESIIESLQYQRALQHGPRQIIMAINSDPDAAIRIQSSQQGQGLASITVIGARGADLLVAMSSAYTAAKQGVEVSHAVDGANGVWVMSVKQDFGGGEEWVVLFRNMISGFPVGLELTIRMIQSLQIMLNDAIGEYRRQIAQIEKMLSPAS